MKIVKDKILLKELKRMAKETFGSLVKAVIDIEKGVMAINGELHADEEALLLKEGSDQKNLWGINIYPDLTGDDMIEFDSMINLRPSQENLSREVENPQIQQKIREVVNKLVAR